MEILPIDDTRHCPIGVRISDKPTTRSTKTTYIRGKNKEPFTAKRVYVFKFGRQIYAKSHTVSELAEMLMIPVGTINATLQRNGKTRDGHSFKIHLDTTA